MLKRKKESKKELENPIAVPDSMTPIEVEGLLDKPLWYGIKCKCDKSDIEKSYPIANCLHCKFTVQEKSLQDVMTKGQFKIGKVIIKKIKIHRGEKYQEVRGWYNLG